MLGNYNQPAEAVPVLAAFLDKTTHPELAFEAGRALCATGSTDHVSFDAVGIPGFQFVQDQLDYFSHVHHTHLDVQDHAVANDLKQASAIVASFVYNTAMRPAKLPRKPFVEK